MTLNLDCKTNCPTKKNTKIKNTLKHDYKKLKKIINQSGSGEYDSHTISSGLTKIANSFSTSNPNNKTINLSKITSLIENLMTQECSWVPDKHLQLKHHQ